MPHVHAHTGRGSQEFENARLCNVLKAFGVRGARS
jgi:hypothetical protein